MHGNDSQTIDLPTMRCKRCLHEWTPRKPEMPLVCPKCKSPYWNRDRVVSNGDSDE